MRHRDRIAACYYTKRGHRHMLFIVPAGGRFDPQLSSESAVLDADVVRALPTVQFESLQVPLHYDFSHMKLIYGERS